MSLLRATMDANGINMVAVGLEQLGADQFVEAKFFDGGSCLTFRGEVFYCLLTVEVYIDEGKKTYQDLGYRRFNWITVFKALFSQISRASLAEGKRRNIPGNLSGDALQNGGLLIVSKGGVRVLLNHREEVPGDHVPNDEILKVLGVTEIKPPE